MILQGGVKLNDKQQEKLRKDTMILVGVIGILALCATPAILFFDMQNILNGNMSLCWLPVLLSLGGVVAILVGFNVISIEPIRALFRVENETWKDNLKQGLRAFAVGVPAVLFGGTLLALALIVTPGESDSSGRFILGGVLLGGACAVGGLMLVPISVKIWIITIRRHRAEDDSFDDRKWIGSEFLNDMICGKS
jgi:hypothetical protein